MGMSTLMTKDSVLVGNRTWPSGEDLTGKEGYIGYLSSSTIVLADSASLDRGAFASQARQGGVIVNGGQASGDDCALVTGPCWVKTGGALSAGETFTNDSSGLAVSAATSSDVPLGEVIQGAASGGYAFVNYTGPIYPTT